MAESLGKTVEVYQPDTLIAGDFPRAEKPVLIKSGQGVLPRGTLLGEISKEAGAVTPGGTNTGDGTCVVNALGAKTKKGTYKVVFTAATTFYLLDPDGYRCGEGVVGTALQNPHMDVTLTAGGTAWVSGDYFDIAIDAPATEYFVKSLAASLDGSQDPDCILGAEVDATSADVLVWAFDTGDYSQDDITYGTGHTAASVKDALRAKSVFLHEKTKLNPNFPP